MRYQELDGTWKEEENFQDRILKKMYTTVLGRMVLKPLIQPGVSRICGRFLDSRFSKWMIPPFIKANKIDMRPYEEKQYRSQTKLEVLDDEFSVENNRNPISFIKTRIKKPNSRCV